MSANCFSITCNLDGTPVDGTLEEPAARSFRLRGQAQDHLRK